MPISISALRVDRRTITIEFNEKESLKLTYDPNKINVEREKEESDLRSQGLNIAALATGLSGIILEWDLLDEHGKPLPVTLETLKSLPYSALLRMNREINKDFFPLMRSE